MKHSYAISLMLIFFWLSESTFGQAPILSASGNQLYCPLSSLPITTAFNIQNTASSPVNAIYLQISEGYDSQNDKLILTGTYPSITANWDQSTGKLRLSLSAGAPLNDLINAVQNVNFQSNNPAINGTRVFSITSGQANYLASTGHYYEYVADYGISWSEARDAAEQRTYYGLQGYLATLSTAEEAQLGGEQSEGAGWLGGTDETTEGVWKWVTGPEGLNGGMVFWNGGNSGSSPNFAFWNVNQPDNAHGGPGEDYLHITDPSVGIRGAWNDLRVAGDPPGVYHPKGYIVEYGGMPGDPEVNISASTQIYTPEISETNTDYSCGTGQVSLSAMADKGNVYWFTTETGGSPVHEGTNYNPSINSTTDFYVSAGPDGCYDGTRERITVNYYNPINASNEVSLTNCAIDNSSNPTSTFYLEEAIPLLNTDPSYNFDFYDSQADAEIETNELQHLILENTGNRSVFVRISNTTPCYKIAEINLKVSTSSLPDGFVHNLSYCDDDGVLDGKHVFDLREAKTPLLNALPANQNFKITFYKTADNASKKSNPIMDEENYINETADQQEIFVRIDNQDTKACYSIGPYVKLVVHEIPQFDLSNSGQVCNLQPDFDVKILNAAGNYSYQWHDEDGTLISHASNITIERPGVYSVFAISNKGCTSETKIIEILESGPPNLTRENIEISATGDSYKIDVIDLDLLGNGNYEFTLNDPTATFQDEAVFYNVTAGTHTLYSRDKNGCGTSSLKLFLFGIPKYFTPNRDGHNDLWNLLGISNEYRTPIIIYDRYGKVIKQLDPQSKGWDGTYQGKDMPADDYWFQLKLKDGRDFSGHFSLIR